MKPALSASCADLKPATRMRVGQIVSFAALLLAFCDPALAAPAGPSPEPLYFLGIPVDFILFALTLLGVALFHHRTLQVALTGLAAIVAYKLGFTGFKFGPGLGGLALHMQHEWVILANLFLLLMGFALLSRHFEKSKLPDIMPAYLPDDWKGAFLLLVIVCVLSSFLDNIAAALIGGVMAREVFRGKVHIGYLAAIVAASNAGGAGSVVGDTTTTMMWIAGVSPLSVVEAYVAVAVAIFIFGIPAAFQQQKYSPIMKDMPPGIEVEWSPRRHRVRHPARRDPGQRDRQRSLSRAAGRAARHRRRRMGGPARDRAVEAARLGGDAGDLQGHHLPVGAGDLRLADAGREAARPRPGRRPWGSASSPPCSTTSRSPRWP